MESATSEAPLLLAQERRNRILELSQQRAAVRICDLSKMFKVSDVTIRSDLELLAEQGYLIRSRGGAVANVRPSLTSAFEHRAGRNLDEKQRIGAAAARMVGPGDTIIMDAGSTLMEMAKSLNRVSPLTVITNALNIAMQVGSLPEVSVFIIGGSLNRLSLCTIGLQAGHDLYDLVAQKVFLGIPAISPDAGLTDLSIESARTKRAMIAAAQQVILLADSSKWGEVGFAKVMPLERVTTFITDTGLPDDARAIIERGGTELILV